MMSKQDVRSGFDLWQEYTEAYIDLTLEAIQRTVTRSLTFRERLDHIVADAVQRNQALNAQEQQIALGAAEALQAQIRSTSETVAKLFSTISPS